ncbi:MAG: amidase [Advenella sp.]|uniref:Amidase n=1 Tax=Advenella kashmirensis TaxID=310575 RepID=A0A356LAQ0_9BURK|nr:amidase [Advenella sp. FME57]HBP28067.1 amidase [Advenella kashmirensis]
MNATNSYEDLRDPDIHSQLLERIGRQEPAVQAWAWFDPDVLARTLKELKARAQEGALSGLAVGIKDIIDVAGMPTGNGVMQKAPLPCAGADADCVALLRQAGAVAIGKTVTAEMAYAHAGPTSNPWNPAHTPGGSSSGSAAAVACGMVAAALGTQTGGSIIRPAAYCGTVGFKPTYGLVSMKGVTGVSPRLDTLGWFTTNVKLADRIAQVLLPTQPAPTAARMDALRVARVDALHAGPAAETISEMDMAGARLTENGANVSCLNMEDEWKTLTIAHKTIMFYEMAYTIQTTHAANWRHFSATLRATCEQGSGISKAEYHHALNTVKSCEVRLLHALQNTDVILTPSAKGAAPRGLGSTGESTFNRIWTLLGWPAIHLPTTQSRGGLPLGVQLIGKPGTDRQLLWTANLVHQRIDRRIVHICAE